MKNETEKMGLSAQASCLAFLDGRTLYEADCKKRPNYHDGSPRKTWERLGNVAQRSWKCPKCLWSGDADTQTSAAAQHIAANRKLNVKCKNTLK